MSLRAAGRVVSSECETRIETKAKQSPAKQCPLFETFTHLRGDCFVGISALLRLNTLLATTYKE